MVAAHFTKITWEPITAYKEQEKPYFCHIYPWTNGIVYAVNVSIRLELWVNVKVAIFSSLWRILQNSSATG